MESLKVRILRPLFFHQLPSRSEPGSIGYDLCADNSFKIYPGKIEKITTGLAMSPPNGYYIQIMSRSSLALENIHVVGGTVDPSYTGEIIIMLENRGACAVWINTGDRCAQMLLLKIATPSIEVVAFLRNSSRGEKGFGSSGRSCEPQLLGSLSSAIELGKNRNDKRHPNKIPKEEQDERKTVRE